MKNTYWIGCFVMIFFCNMIKAQSIKVDTLTYDKVKNYLSSYRVNSSLDYVIFSKDSTGVLKNIALKTKEHKRTIYKGRDVLLVIQRYQTTTGVDQDTAVIDPQSMKPFEYHSQLNSGPNPYGEHVFFGENKINVSIIYRDSTINNEYPFSGTPFISTTDKTIIQSLPLKEGYETFFKSINPGRRQSTSDVHVKVLESVKFNTGDISFDAYRIGIAYGKKPLDGSYKTQIWITKKDQQVLKLQFSNFFTETRIF